jgi:hypothetical protein
MRTPEDARKLSHQVFWNKKIQAVLDRDSTIQSTESFQVFQVFETGR